MEPFSFSIVRDTKREASLSKLALPPDRPIWASQAAVGLASTLYDSSSDEEYSTDGWGFEASGRKSYSIVERRRHSSLSSEDGSSSSVQHSQQQPTAVGLLLSPAVSPEAPAAAAARDSEKHLDAARPLPRGSVDSTVPTLSALKDTQDFKQVSGT
jgi:hypothetical protein